MKINRYLSATESVGRASFADAAGRDFHLTAGSNALSGALAISGFLVDYVGHHLTGRLALDIGAVEYWG
jgi:hypothetical protein